MGRGRKIDPLIIAAVYAWAMPLVVAFLASPIVLAAFAGPNAQTYAAWVQAIGSIAAIFGGFAVAARHIAHEQAAETSRRSIETKEVAAASVRAERSRAIIAIALATRALNVSGERLKARRGELLPGQPRYALRGIRTKVTLDALATLDLNAMPAVLIPPLVDLRSCLQGVYEEPDYETDERDMILQAVFATAEDAWAKLLDQAQAHCGISDHDIEKAFEDYGITQEAERRDC